MEHLPSSCWVKERQHMIDQSKDNRVGELDLVGTGTWDNHLFPGLSGLVCS